MKALTFHGKAAVIYETVPDPVIEEPGDAIVKVDVCAICGSDMHPYHEREKGLDHGTVMGHEFVGEIVEVGSEVRHLTKGREVFSPFTTNCGDCFYCRKGLTARCVHGRLFGWIEKNNGLHGGQAEFVRVPMADSTLLEIPDGVRPEEALLLGDIFSTGYFCAENAEIEPGGVYVVVGCGPVGLMAIAAARELGAEQILACDTIPERLALAGKFGATTVDFKEESVIDFVREKTDGRGADAVLEVVGSHAAGRNAFELVRPGGIISTVGVHTDTRLSFTPAEAYDKNITYKVGRCSARFYMQKLLPIIQKNTLDLTRVITHRASLSHGPEAYRMFDNKADGCLKVVLQP